MESRSQRNYDLLYRQDKHIENLLELLVIINMVFSKLTRSLNKKSVASKHVNCIQATQSEWSTPEDYIAFLERHQLLQ